MYKTLYVSDLDGTLLHSNERMSERSCNIINSLVDKGMIFSYATARSVHTASKATSGLIAKIPLIVYNGAFIVDNLTKERICTNTFTDIQAEEIYCILTDNGIEPIVYSLINGIEKFSYFTDKINGAVKAFINTRENSHTHDFRNNPLSDNDDILKGEKYYFTCIDDEEKLYPVYMKLRESYTCVYHKDIYSGDRWLEIMPIKSTKANAILQLKELYNCDRVVSFGDGSNDIPMFKISDECYAVANAADELKKLATGIISSNNDDGVARWLIENL